MGVGASKATADLAALARVGTRGRGGVEAALAKGLQQTGQVIGYARHLR